MKRQSDEVYLLKDETATGAGTPHRPWGAKRSFLVFGQTTSGSGAAQVQIEFSNSRSGPFVTGIIFNLTLSDSSVEADGETTDAPWVYARANVISISGTGASLSVTMGS